ncbi:MAG: PilZ domain-containing protein [Alphaproteobacteria bacterium]|nr:MAG: PilZ domain-containing protein [Alphaproteobacteria bacterium]
MNSENRRETHRFRLEIRATVIHPYTRASYPCLIRDGSISGCKLQCRYIRELPRRILLHVPELTEEITGDIVWSNDIHAGVEFKWQELPGDDRRRTPRREVQMQATIYTHDYHLVCPCVICDASPSGCRIALDDSSIVPDQVRIEVKNLTEPLLARVVWRSEGSAGLQFAWDFEAYDQCRNDEFDAFAEEISVLSEVWKV